MKKLIATWFWVLGFFAFGALAQAAASAPPAAAKPVEHLQSTLISAMKAGKSLDYRARYDKLHPVVRQAFDFHFIARMVLGSDWSKLTASQQKRFIDALDKLSTSSYAKEFDSYSGENFAFDSARKLSGGELVRYVFKSGDGKAVHFDYQLLQAGGHWKIANVVVDGVSDLALKRGQYRKLFSERGYKGLIAWIDDQIRKNSG